MATLKTLTIAAALIAGATSLAMAQNGLPTGNEKPVAGRAAGDPGPVSGKTAKSSEHKASMSKSMYKEKTQ